MRPNVFYLCIDVASAVGATGYIRLYRPMIRLSIILLMLLLSLHAGASNVSTDIQADDSVCAAKPHEGKSVYLFPIRENIMPSTARMTAKCLRQAVETGADYVVIDLNTYGGIMDAADTIRTLLLNAPMPVLTFVNNQAASAGALIAIASDSIYMRPGASIGAATVVDQSGKKMPDKYQSFMRSMMRSTAEAHGKRADINGTDTIWRWHRDPRMAEAMVDERIRIDNLVDSTQILTFTTEEAIRNGYCEGSASSVEELLAKAGINNYTMFEYKPSRLDRVLGFLTNPVLQGILIMLIVGGIYFELQSPGIGFPLIMAVAAAVLYFAPLYIEGVVRNWELILFLVGIVLVIVEIFVTPGFGVIGIGGIVAIVLGLSFAVIDNDLLRHIPTGEISPDAVLQPVLMVIVAIAAAFVLSLWLGKRFLTGVSPLRNKVVLTSEMTPDEGYLSHEMSSSLVGSSAVATTDLHPAGKVDIDGRIYQATADNGLFIPRGSRVTVIRAESGVLYCRAKQ